MENDDHRMRQALARVYERVDLDELATHIAMSTYGGREPSPKPWEYTREYLGAHGDPANAEGVIALLEELGWRSEIEVVRWVERHGNSR